MNTHGRRERRTDLTLWYCNGCEGVHLSAADFRLTLDRSEFAAVTRMVIETHYSGWSDAAMTLAADHINIDARETTASIEHLH